nr:MAG TPA: hypothetical protein [Caudoviricetes sp.]
MCRRTYYFSIRSCSSPTPFIIRILIKSSLITSLICFLYHNIRF